MDTIREREELEALWAHAHDLGTPRIVLFECSCWRRRLSAIYGF